MARVVKQRQPEAKPETRSGMVDERALDRLAGEKLLGVHRANRPVHIRSFIAWAKQRGLAEPLEVTRPVLESYQRYLFYYRKKNGEPLSFRPSTRAWCRCACGLSG